MTFYAKLNFIQRESIVKEYKDGANTADLADKYGCSRSTINDILNKAGVETRRNMTIDEELAKTMREEYEAGATTTVLASKYKSYPKRVCEYIRHAGGEIRRRGPVQTA